MPVFRVVYRVAGVRPQAAGNDLPPNSGWRPHSAAAADILQPRVHPHVFRADLVHVGCRVRFRSWRPRLCGWSRGSGGLVVAWQSGSGFRDRFAVPRLRHRGLGQRTNADEYDKEFHFQLLLPDGAGHQMQALSKGTAITQSNQRVCWIIATKMHVTGRHVYREFQGGKCTCAAHRLARIALDALASAARTENQDWAPLHRRPARSTVEWRSG